MARARRRQPPPPPPPPPPSLIRELPPEERPRQRLLRVGGEVLSNREILSLILGSGSPGVCPLGLARDLLEERGGLAGLVGIQPEGLRRRGLGEAKAASILAALELARRLAHAEVPKRQPMSDPLTVVKYLFLRYSTIGHEILGALYLDVRHRLMGDREIYRGTLSRAAVEPREIFHYALVRGAASVVIWHTHPSGDPTPSLEDRSFTRRVAEAGYALGVSLVDHLIVGSTGRWVSLKDRGAFR